MSISRLNCNRMSTSYKQIIYPLDLRADTATRPGSVAVNVEVQAQLRDIAHLQLGNESALEVTKLAKVIEAVCDRHGRLIVTNRLRSLNGATIALAMQYQSLRLAICSWYKGALRVDVRSDIYRKHC